MASEVLRLKSKKWIKSVMTIQKQAKQRFAIDDKSAFVECLRAVLAANTGAASINNSDLEVLKIYTLNTQPDDFKAAVENFFILLEKHNTPSQLKDLYQVVEEEGAIETLQKIYDSALYEKQQATEALIEKDVQQWTEEVDKLYDKFNTLTPKAQEAFKLVLKALQSGKPISHIDQIFQPILNELSKLSGMEDEYQSFIQISNRYMVDEENLRKFRTFFSNEQLELIGIYADEYVGDPLDALKLTGVSFDYKDYLGKRVNNPSTIYNTIQYLYFNLSFDAPLSLKEVPLKVSVFYPDGDLMHSYDETFSVDHKNKKIYADGIGSTRGLSYKIPGVWTVKFYIKGKELLSKNFKIEDAPYPSLPTIKVNSIRFDNTDYKNTTITKGSLPFNTQYVTPVINYTRLQNIGCMRLGYRIYNPDGTLQTGKSSPSGLTGINRIVPDESGEVRLSGWGNNEGSSYAPGKYKFVLVQGKNVLYTTYFHIKSPFDSHSATQTAPTTSYTPSKPIIRTTSSKKKSRGCLSSIKWLFILGAISLGAYWYCNRTVGETRYTVGDVNLVNENGKIISTVTGSSEIELIESKDGRAKIKYDGKKGYIPANLVVTKDELARLNDMINDNPALKSDFGRKALYDFTTNNPSVVDNPGNWRVYNNFGLTKPYSVMTPAPKIAGVDSVIAFVVSSENRYQRGVYHLMSDGEIKRVMNQEIPFGNLMTRITYNAKTGKYDISYAKDDKIVSPTGRVSPSAEIPFLITDISLVTVNSTGKETSSKVTKKSEFVAPKISYFSYEKGATIDLLIKIYDPSGKLVQEDTSPVGATYMTSIQDVSKHGHIILNGWRNLGQTPSWEKSGYRFEIWNENGMLASCKLKLK